MRIFSTHPIWYYLIAPVLVDLEKVDSDFVVIICKIKELLFYSDLFQNLRIIFSLNFILVRSGTMYEMPSGIAHTKDFFVGYFVSVLIS